MTQEASCDTFMVLAPDRVVYEPLELAGLTQLVMAGRVSESNQQLQREFVSEILWR